MIVRILLNKINQLISLSIIFSFIFPYEDKFSFVSNVENIGKVSLNTNVELVYRGDGYTRLAKIGQGHTSIEGMPELPIFTTFYQLDPSKTYDFDFQVLDSYFIENILVFPHQGMEKWDVESVNIINEDAYDSQIPYPEKNLVISDRHQGRGIEFISLSVTPYKYYPKHKKLEVFS